MAFLSGFVKSGLSLLGKDASAFPYTIGPKVEWYENQSIWSLHRGTKKEDNSEVSIFTFDVVKNRNTAQLAKHAYKKMRTLRHPDLLRFLDGVENDQAIMIVTDAVEPLSDQLKQNADKNLTLWGLYKIASAIKFINNDCGMVHGNVRISSIFTNKAGEWKLGGFELLDSMKEESPMIMTFGGIIPDAKRYASPEIKKSGWTVIKELPTSATDSFQLGCLIYETYNGHMDSTDKLMSTRGDIPAKMQSVYKLLLTTSPKARIDSERFLDEGLRPQGFFSNEFIQVNLFLENITIKDQSEKDVFFRKLDNVIESFPQEFSIHKILPELINAFEYGAGGPKVLSSIIKVGSHLPDEEYVKVVIPCIIRMYAAPDRGIRMALLEMLPSYVDRLTKKIVNDQIFPHVALGFTDGVPMIREQTIKGILLLVPMLNDRVINYDLLKYLAKLQMDEEPGIRTNTTICLGKIAKHLNAATQKKVLVPAFARSLKDGFHHARIAGLMALNATAEYYDALDCATRIIPCISLVLLDKEKPVRMQAFKTLDVFIKRVSVFAEAMPDTAIVESIVSPQIAEGGPGTFARSNSASAAAAGVAGVLGEATKGFAGWAVTSLATRLASPGEMASSAPVNMHSASDPSLNKYASTTAPAPAPDTPNPDRIADRLALADLDEDQGDSWDNDDDDNLIGLEDDAWEPLDTTPAQAPEPVTSFVPKRSLGTSASKQIVPPKVDRASQPGSMKLGHKTKFDVDDWGFDDNNETKLANTTHSSAGHIHTSTNRSVSPAASAPATVASNSSSVLSKEDRKAELDRRREERRQRMAELREKKTGGIGAKKL
ncbi:unnamed protein product [Umbelopsis ramanniana]